MKNEKIFKNISFSYPKSNEMVFENLNLNIKKNEKIAIFGNTGSGKSTLLNLISLIDKPSIGSIKFDNHEVNYAEKEENDKFRAKKIGIVYQQNNLLPNFTSLENIYLASLSINNDKDLAISKAKQLLKKIGLSNRADHYPSQLSGGEAQRIAIARAIINDPEIILADEPTGSLDMRTAKVIFNLLKDQKRSNRLIIFATHNRFFGNKADCLLEILDGNIKSSNG